MTIENQQAQSQLALAMQELWVRLNPDRKVPETVIFEIEEIADKHAAAFTQAAPNLLKKLTQADLDRISEALDFHYDMTERTLDDEANKALVAKLDRLNTATPTPPRRPRAGR